TDPVYNAHSYHTKVPHRAIMRYILHYTEPGDVVFDGFCGTGMLGVAAQLCGNPVAVAGLGYALSPDGSILDENQDVIGRCGVRTAILNDLSPAATLIAAGYNLTSDAKGFARLASKMLDRFNDEYGWMYETRDPKTGASCQIDFTVWSEEFLCPHCSGELEFWDLAYDESSGKVEDEPCCPHCSAEVPKRDLIRRTTTYYDGAVRATRTRQVLRPVEIHFQHQGVKKKKKPDEQDFATLDRVRGLMETIEYPTELMMFIPEGEEWGDLYRGYHEGISRVHDFYLPRQLVAFSLLWHMGDELLIGEMKRLWRFTLQSVLVSFTRRNRFRKKAYSQVNTNLSGTLYIGSTISEPSPTYCLSGKIRRAGDAIPTSVGPAAITTQSLASVLLPDSSVDYVFIDPPFGDNLPYAELNFLWEAWLRVFTNSSQDIVVSGKQRKDLTVYTNMMTACLREVYRILKPGRWVTVEFHNSKNAVWTAIQEAHGRAGFIIADVSVLDKGLKTKK
ncbi:MAG: DNA methyltransferase, partial [Bacillota bacterium]